MHTPASLKDFGTFVQRLLNREDLAFDDTYALFRDVLDNRQPDLHQGAFLAALAAKGETAIEVAAAWNAIMDLDTVRLAGALPPIRVENSGTGMDSLKTFNVSSAAAIVAAAGGVTVVRHGARALTSFCGTVDILESLGLDVECDAALVLDSINRTNIGLFNGMSPAIHPGGLGRILSQIRFGSILNIAASLANPARPTHAVRGVWSEAMVERVAGIMPAIGIQQGLVVHGLDDQRPGGMDELSVTGPSVVCAFKENGATSTSRIRPEDAGLATHPFAAIATTGDLDRERLRFLRVLAGRGEEACVAFTCLNAAAVLLVAGQASDLAHGATLSRHAIEERRALAKLREWIGVQNRQPDRALSHLEALERRAFASSEG